MDWGYKAVLTEMTVAAVLMTAQIFGRRLAGLVAGLPVIAAPSLMWIAAEHGEVYAARCAVGGVAACGAAAVFAVIYERVARRHGLLPSMGAALGGGGLTALALALLTRGAHGLAIALLATTTLCTWALRRLPAAPPSARPTRRLRGELSLTASVAGFISAAIALWSPLLGAFWWGLLASLPVISSAALVQQHLSLPHADRQRCLRGYAMGLAGKAAFAATFAGVAAQAGVSLAMALAAVVGIAVSIGLARQLAAAEAQAASALAVIAPPYT